MAFKTTLIVAALAIIYKVYLHDFATIILGIGRTVQPIQDFNYDCHRLHHPLLEGCEDIWLDKTDRKLYASCTKVESKREWCPSVNKYNLSAPRGRDHIAVLDIDNPGDDGLYGVRKLQYDGELDLNGFDAREVGDNRLRFWLVNHRPAVGPTGELLDAKKVGANSTIEILELERGSTQLKHIKTIASEAIISPNNLVVDDDGVGVYVTNDHNGKVGMFRELEMIFGNGNVAYCNSETGKCHIAAEKGFNCANGITKHEGLVYVANSAKGRVTVYQPENGQLHQVDQIDLRIPIDNFSVDADGTIFVAAFPDSLSLRKAFEEPYTTNVPSTIYKITKSGPDYEFTKVIEDAAGQHLPGSTTAIHDTVSDRLILSGVASPFITICTKK
ncbi:hypothetical protein AWENTII_002300 [Aspergillus wentii]|nr:hypothetical protein MW887_008103 [Aspergillus wentii]